MSDINTAKLKDLAIKWERISAIKFDDAESENNEFGKKFIEHGAVCYFNCASQLRHLLESVNIPLDSDSTST
jgi:hypothetical protein